jgi:hypothetical protein
MAVSKKAAAVQNKTTPDYDVEVSFDRIQHNSGATQDHAHLEIT